MTSASNLAYWLRTQATAPPSLAYCHTTNMWKFQSIVESGHLLPKRCNVFNEELSYLFYGRPAYRQKSDPIVTSAKAPAVIIFNSRALGIPKRIFPFDSGAFPNRYKTWLANGMKLTDFELDADLTSPLRHVLAFFENNANYWQCKCEKQPKAAGVEFELETLFKIYNDTSPPEGSDDRKHAIEVQINQPLPINNTTVHAIILPQDCIDHEFIKNFRATSGNGINFIGYELNSHKTSGEYQFYLEDCARKLHESLGLL